MAETISLNFHTLFSSKTLLNSVSKLEEVERIVKVFEVNNSTIIVLYQSSHNNYISVEIPIIINLHFKRFIEIIIKLCSELKYLDDYQLLKELIVTILGFNEMAIIDFKKNIISNFEFSVAISEAYQEAFIIEWGEKGRKSWFSILTGK